MTALYRGELVRVVAYAAKGDRSQIATKRGLRWVPTCQLEVLPWSLLISRSGTSPGSAVSRY